MGIEIGNRSHRHLAHFASIAQRLGPGEPERLVGSIASAFCLVSALVYTRYPERQVIDEGRRPGDRR
jgi:hypothetical protein